MRDIGRIPGTGSAAAGCWSTRCSTNLARRSEICVASGVSRMLTTAVPRIEVVDLDIDHLERERVARDDEAELADLGHRATEEEGGAERHPETSTEDGDDEALADDGDQDEERDGRRRREERLGIDEHPDRHEEQDREQVAERDDLGGGLVRDIGLATR